MRAVLSALSLLVIGLGFLGFGGWNYYAGTTGEKTTAVVDQCTKSYGRKGRTRTTCYGTWQENGVSKRGQIDGVGDDDQGKSVEVRIHDGEAYAFNWVGVLLPAGVGGFMLVAAVFWASSAFKGGEKQPAWQGGAPPHPPAYGRPPHPPAYGRPPQPQPGPPGYPPPGYPRPGYPPAGYPQPAPHHAAYPPPGYPQPAYQPPPGYAPQGYPPQPGQYPPAGGYPPPGYPPPQYPPAQ
ncbi:hypothetical protein [Cryptosporangium sp. NPDC048952]|uniref:hypothetical protein n=1 Tax=Cryptosporangium sp. NPDC048952 TaxID=3363961 RepID=UPI003712CE4A